MPELPISLGFRRELFVDEFLIERMDSVELRLHHPTPREIALEYDEPWEGNSSGYCTVFRDGDRCRMYYKGLGLTSDDEDTHPHYTCYAESSDGIHWTKPDLGLVEFGNSRHSNIIWDGWGGDHVFVPFRDTNPDCAVDATYKAFCPTWPQVGPRLWALKSTDGIRWSLLHPEPVMDQGYFDSQNLAFWDPGRTRYVAYFRDFRTLPGHRPFRPGIRPDERIDLRDVKFATSADFVHWSDPVWLEYPGAPDEHIYTNQVLPYPRAPHLWLGFPMRFLPFRTEIDGGQWGLSDGLFMSTRDGVRFRRWGEAFIRPGLQPSRWISRRNMTAWGLLQTRSELDGPEELSLYSPEGLKEGGNRLRRFTLRLDGFVSVHARLAGGELLTKPLTFSGTQLSLNGSTSAAGSLVVEILDATDYKPLARSEEWYGDDVEYRVRWQGRDDLQGICGRPVRLRFRLSDADLFAIQFVSSKMSEDGGRG